MRATRAGGSRLTADNHVPPEKYDGFRVLPLVSLMFEELPPSIGRVPEERASPGLIHFIRCPRADRIVSERRAYARHIGGECASSRAHPCVVPSQQWLGHRQSQWLPLALGKPF